MNGNIHRGKLEVLYMGLLYNGKVENVRQIEKVIKTFLG